MADEPTKKDLLETLKDALERSNQLASENAVALEQARVTITEQGRIIDDLVASREASAAQPLKVVPQPVVPTKPYSGHVKAVQSCFVSDTLRQEGDVFFHEVAALWEDDPFVPVILKGVTDEGKHITEPHPEGVDAPVVLPYKLRPRSVDELARRAAEPIPASKW